MDAEIWKPVVGYEGRYEVSNFGNVRSLNYIHRKGYVKNLAPCMDKYGYLHVMLFDGKKNYATIHSLVAKAFHGVPVVPMTVNHKNEVKTDNRADNLEWMAAVENSKYGTAQLRSALNRRKPVIATDKDGNETRFGSLKEAAAAVGTKSSFISQALRRRSKITGGLKWRFAS